MRLIEAICIGALILFGALMALFLRRELISRGSGTIDMSLRLNTFVPERGWAPGLGRFSGDELRWYRLFSFSVRPRRVLRRNGLVVEHRRLPEGVEKLATAPAMRKTVNYGGGARWFFKNHLAFSVDVRWYSIAEGPLTTSDVVPRLIQPKTTLMVLSGGISLK